MSYVAERTSTLVIGWGNELRGDDAAGRMLARSVQGWELPDVDVLELHQLLPETAASVAEVDRVVFIDARVAPPGAGAEVERVSRGGRPLGAHGLGHHVGPEQVLELAWRLYQAEPEAWVVTVPGSSFDVGRPPGESTRRAMGQAESELRELLASDQRGLRSGHASPRVEAKQNHKGK